MSVKTIHLHGALGTKYGLPQIELDVASPREAVNALANQLPGFRDYVRNYDWQVIAGDLDDGLELGADELTFQPGNRDIHFVPLGMGAKSKGGIGKIIAGVALIALSVYTGGAAGAAGFEALVGIESVGISLGNVGMFGVSLALSGVSALLTPTPEFSGPGEQVAEGKSAMFRGPQNVAEQGGAIPLIYGRFEVGSTVISAGIATEKVPVEEEASQESSANTTNGSGGQGGSNDSGVIEYPDPDGPGGYKGGGKGGGGGGRVAKEAANTLRSRATARVLDLVSEGEIGGLVNGAKSIKFGDTPLQSSNGKYNFNGVNWDSRVGLPDQSWMKGFSSAETENEINQQVTKDTPVIFTVEDPDVDAVRVTLRIPSLYKTDPKTGDVKEHFVKIGIDVQSNGGGYKRSESDTIGHDKCTSIYERSYRIDLPPGGSPWQIRMVRISDDNDELIFQDDTWFSRCTELTDVKMTYPHCAYFGLEVDAEQFGDNVPDRSYDIYGIKIKVPSNYDWKTRSYSTTIWDGTFHPTKVPCDNPAWIIYDLAENDRYGIGKELSEAGISKWDLYEIGKRCDQYIPDGFGGSEPRFTFNGALISRDEAQRFIAYLSSTFMGMAWWGGNTLQFSHDAPKNPTRIVTTANVIGGEFNYTGSSRKSRHTAVHVKWYDPDDQCRPSAIEVVEDADAIHQIGYRKKEVLGFGIKTRGAARRYGKWILDTEQNSTETVTYSAGLDHADVMPGEVIQIADPARMAVRAGGRLAGATGASITLDAPFEFETGRSYYLSVVLADQTVESQLITSGQGEMSSITVESSFTSDPPAEHMWVIASQEVELPQYTVLFRKELSDTRFEISALQYDPTKFDRVERDIVLDPPSFNQFPTGEIEPPTGGSHQEYLYETAGTLQSAVLFSWELSKDPRVTRYVVEYKEVDGDWREAGSTGTSSMEIRETSDGDWSFRVRAITGLGRPSEWLSLTAELVTLKYPPDDVLDFDGVVKGEMMNLDWAPVPNLDLDHYILKFVYSGSPVKWANGITLDDKIPKTATSHTVQALAGTYMLKAIDTSGIESVNYISVFSDVSNLFELNVVQDMPQEPDWNGTKTDMIVIDDKLYLSPGDMMIDWPALSDVTTLYQGVSGDIATEGYYDLPDVVDLGRVGTIRVTTQLEVAGIALDGQGTELESVNYEAYFEISLTDDDPNNSPTWTSWKRVVAADYMHRGFKMRLFMRALDVSTRPVVSKANVIFDVPDRVERTQGVSCSTAGISVNYVVPYRNIPVLGITASDMQSGDRLVIDNETSTGFTLHFENSGGTNVARTFNYTAQGYGYG